MQSRVNNKPGCQLLELDRPDDARTIDFLLSHWLPLRLDGNYQRSFAGRGLLENTLAVLLTNHSFLNSVSTDLSAQPWTALADSDPHDYLSRISLIIHLPGDRRIEARGSALTQATDPLDYRTRRSRHIRTAYRRDPY